MKTEIFKKLDYTILGKDSEIKGNITVQSPAYILGNIHGEVTVLGDDKLVVEIGANIQGKIFCRDVEVLGSVSGEIHSEGTLLIRSSGRVDGSFNSKKLVIQPGAALNVEGHSE